MIGHIVNVVVPGTVISKKNSKMPVYVGGKNKPRRLLLLPSKAYRVWEQQVRDTMTAIGYRTPKAGPCSVKATFFYKGNRPDLSGAMESIADALEGYLWENDRDIISWDGSRLYHDLQNPRTELCVTWEAAA